MSTTRRIAAAVLLVCVSGLAAGCGGSQSDAGEFMGQVVRDKLEGNYTRYWDTLHPAQQAVVSQQKLADCLSGQTAAGEFEGIKVLDTYEDDFSLTGIPQQTAQVVTLRLDTKQDGDTAHSVLTAYAVEVDGDWRWVMSPAEVDAFKSGECP